jgi:hypothetical protein
VRLRWVVSLIVLAVAGLSAVGTHAADIVPTRTYVEPTLRTAVVEPARNSIFLFAGRMSAGDMGTTALFNLNYDGKPWDNYIVGGAYQRDVWRWRQLIFGFEVGVADRFGHYKVCCSPLLKSDSLLHSGELWGGGVIRSEPLLLFNTVRIAISSTVGLSATTNSIGRERGREIGLDGNARLLFYWGPELNFSHVSNPNIEFVMRLHHRSGAGHTLGKMHEGYNAWVGGFRFRF